MSAFGRRCYALRSYGREWLIVRRSDVAAGERALDVPAALALVGGRSPDPQLCRTFASLLGWSATRDAAVRLERALRQRELVVIEAVALQEPQYGAPSATGPGGPASSASPKAQPSSSASQSQTAAPEKTWFRCQLLDEDGQPMPGEKYKMTDSNGAAREGTLDQDGWLYIPPTLAPGACSISFPDIRLNPRKKK